MSDAFAETLQRAGMSAEEADRKSRLFARCRDTLRSEPNGEICLFVPGRLEFLGKHTDYCGGRSLVCSIERGLCFVARPLEDSFVQITALADNSHRTIPLSAHASVPPADWSTYPATVARRVALNFFPQEAAARGLEVAFAGDLPPAAGLSSSSALITGLFLLLSRANNLPALPAYRQSIDMPEDLAGYLGCIENGQTFHTLAGEKGVGTFGGSQDHTAILLGKAGCLSQYSFAPVRLEQTLPMPPGYRIAIATSGVIAQKTANALEKYNRVSRSARTILTLWNHHTHRPDPTLAAAIGSSREALDHLRTLIHAFPEPEFPPEMLLARLDQVVRESTETIPAVAAHLAAHRLEEIASLIAASQRGAVVGLLNQTPETESLVASALACGALAASAFGAGFGGSVWALVKDNLASDFLHRWHTAYASAHPAPAAHSQLFFTRPGPPARFCE